jgi:hypothetical protein
VTSFAEIIKKAKPREHAVPICLAGDLAGEVDRLEAEWRRLGEWKPSSAADSDPRRELGERIEAARQAMREAEVTFTFRALTSKAYSDLLAKHPSDNPKETFDPVTFGPALVAASSLEPKMTLRQVATLFDQINEAQREELLEGAWNVNNQATSVPFSLAASLTAAARGGEN